MSVALSLGGGAAGGWAGDLPLSWGGAQARLVPTRDPSLFLPTLFQSPPLLTVRGTPFQPGGDNPAQHRECLWKGTGRWIEGTGGQCQWGLGILFTWMDLAPPAPPSLPSLEALRVRVEVAC